MLSTTNTDYLRQRAVDWSTTVVLPMSRYFVLGASAGIYVPLYSWKAIVWSCGTIQARKYSTEDC